MIIALLLLQNDNNNIYTVELSRCTSATRSLEE